MITSPNPVACYCCAKAPPQVDALVRVGLNEWRCPDHVGRAPCCIEGCGRTFALDDAVDYAVTYICGKHWRLAPKKWRAHLTRLRAIARKSGWTERLRDLDDKVWSRCVRAAQRAVRGDLDKAEIDRMFGW